jgi:uncharacterized protein (TIGR00730 family)
MGSHRICVIAGSATGRPEYEQVARAFGAELVRRDLGLLCGTSNGLTWPVAEAVLGASRDVIGVVPNEARWDELDRYDTAELREVRSTAERTALMVELADAFVALPGGLETLSELFDVLIWAQLRLHDRPVGVLDAMGYFEPFFSLLDRAATEGLLSAPPQDLLHRDTDPSALLDRLTRDLPRKTPIQRMREHCRGPELVAVLYNVLDPVPTDGDRKKRFEVVTPDTLVSNVETGPVG